MEWRQISNRVVAHTDGHKIELKAGTWSEPFDVHPMIKKGTSSIEAARLIREGLAFATKISNKKRPRVELI